ncbi:MAG: SGNH/GDSL hydrolase family protein [Gemmataceae bacterium]|nr:SGNH/GDSL hydrolase family protein [Gemmataceae bacterium]
MVRCILFFGLAVLGGLPTSALAAEKDEPKLPRVLLIGDSISIGYTPPTAKLLETKAKVVHHAGNAETTRNGLKQLPTWLKEGPFDVIHFNWGLWDLVDGGKAVPIDEYEKNLRELVKQLKETKAKLIWASTTPVPEVNGRKRRDVDVVAYNAVARKIMEENKIPIDDLYEFVKPQLAKLQLANDVHFSKEGSQELAKQVVQSIQKTLEGK